MNPNRPARRGEGGFTLIEAMVTIALTAILLAVVVPSFRTFTYSQRVKSSSFDIYATLMFARSEAIKRRADVNVERISGDWNNGWTVWWANPTTGTNETLRRQDVPKGLSVTSGTGSLTYRLDGHLNSADAGLLLAASDADLADSAGRRCISVDATGLPRTRVLAAGVTTCP